LGYFRLPHPGLAFWQGADSDPTRAFRTSTSAAANALALSAEQKKYRIGEERPSVKADPWSARIEIETCTVEILK
jgi:hypothetical protein